MCMGQWNQCDVTLPSEVVIEKPINEPSLCRPRHERTCSPNDLGSGSGASSPFALFISHVCAQCSEHLGMAKAARRSFPIQKPVCGNFAILLSPACGQRFETTVDFSIVWVRYCGAMDSWRTRPGQCSSVPNTCCGDGDCSALSEHRLQVAVALVWPCGFEAFCSRAYWHCGRVLGHFNLLPCTWNCTTDQGIVLIKGRVSAKPGVLAVAFAHVSAHCETDYCICWASPCNAQTEFPSTNASAFICCRLHLSRVTPPADGATEIGDGTEDTCSVWCPPHWSQLWIIANASATNWDSELSLPEVQEEENKEGCGQGLSREIFQTQEPKCVGPLAKWVVSKRERGWSQMVAREQGMLAFVQGRVRFPGPSGHGFSAWTFTSSIWFCVHDAGLLHVLWIAEFKVEVITRIEVITRLTWPKMTQNLDSYDLC